MNPGFGARPLSLDLLLPNRLFLKPFIISLGGLRQQAFFWSYSSDCLPTLIPQLGDFPRPYPGINMNRLWQIEMLTEYCAAQRLMMRAVSDHGLSKIPMLFFSQSYRFFSLNIFRFQMFQWCRRAVQSPMGCQPGPLYSGPTFANWYVGSPQQQNTTWLLRDTRRPKFLKLTSEETRLASELMDTNPRQQLDIVSLRFFLSDSPVSFASKQWKGTWLT